jgi:hypothetical protein
MGVTVRNARRCVYCGAIATTRDHVISRCLLEKPFPANLPTVHSCEYCNRGFAKDEEYFLAALATSGFVFTLQSKLIEGGVVDRMLTRSRSLDDRINASLQTAEDGRVYLQPELERIARVVRKVAFGLYLKRYTRKAAALTEFDVWPLEHSQSGDQRILLMAHNERFRPKRWVTVQKGVFAYMFVRNWIWDDFGRVFCIMKFHETIRAAVGCPWKQRLADTGDSQQTLPFGM